MNFFSSSNDGTLLVAYLIIIIAFIIYSIFPIFDLWRYGMRGDLSKAVISIYVIASVAVIATTLAIIIFNNIS
jgi:hypothetical protein